MYNDLMLHIDRNAAILADDTDGQTKDVQEKVVSSKSNADLLLDTLVRLKSALRKYPAISNNNGSDGRGDSDDSSDN